MNMRKEDLFIHVMKCIAVCSQVREQSAKLAYDRLLDKAESYETAVADYDHDKESQQNPSAFSFYSVSCLFLH